MHSIEDESKKNLPLSQFMMFLVLSLVIGALAGFLLGKYSPTHSKTTTNNTSNTNESSATAEGVKDKTTFKDKAEGTLQEGGIGGEGDFHLVRPGGDSQNVYLTSTTVDLSKYIGKKVRVYGQTINGQKAGWLMDAGYVELL